MEKIKIAVVDDQQLLRKAIVGMLMANTAFEVVIEAGNGREFIEGMAALKQLPEIVLVDIDMPEMNGMELNEWLQDHHPDIRTIILSVFNQERFISRMISEGANGYLAKNCDMEELVAAIISVHKTGFYFNADCIKALKNIGSSRQPVLKNSNNINIDLTERENEILLLICKEYTNTEIAEALFLSVRTVEGHRNNLLAKVGCRNTAGLVIFAIRRGLYKPWLS